MRNWLPRRCLPLKSLAVFSLLAFCCTSAGAQTSFDPISPAADWQAQDYPDSQAITRVVYDRAHQRLTAMGKFVGDDTHRSKGEVYLDLRYVPELESTQPLDFSATTVAVDVDVPAGFHHLYSPSQPERPNGIQIFFKDSAWRCLYGPWQNTERGRMRRQYRLTYSFATSTPAYEDPGFDPARIMIIGVKFGIAPGSRQRYGGPLYVTSFHIDPPIAVSPLPQPGSPQDPVFRRNSRIKLEDAAFYVDSKRWFLAGANYRALEYAQNFGSTAWWPRGNGVTRHPHYIDYYMNLAEDAGIKVLRVGLGEDGRVLFSPEGRVVGYDRQFKADVRKFLDLAAAHNMRVEFTLLDYLIGAPAQVVSGVQTMGHADVITDPAVMKRYINGFLRPFLRDFRAHPALMSLDLINEPEWLVADSEGGGWDDFSDPRYKPAQPIPLADLHNYALACATAIRASNRRILVTMGVSSRFAGVAAGLPLDYYALHHYPNFGDLAQYLHFIPDGKPWLLEEYPTKGTSKSPADYLGATRSLGGSGALFWNLKPGCDEYTYDLPDRAALLGAIHDWLQANPPT